MRTEQDKDAEQIIDEDVSVLEKLETIYEPLLERFMCISDYIVDSSLKFEEEYSVDHYYKKADGSYDGADYPLPMFVITGICEICINIWSIDFYAYLSDPLPDDVLKRFRIREAVEINAVSELFLFRMEKTLDGSRILGFTEELKKAGGTI